MGKNLKNPHPRSHPDENENQTTYHIRNVILTPENALYLYLESPNSSIVKTKSINLPSDSNETKNQRTQHSQNATFTLKVPLTGI